MTKFKLNIEPAGRESQVTLTKYLNEENNKGAVNLGYSADEKNGNELVCAGCQKKYVTDDSTVLNFPEEPFVIRKRKTSFMNQSTQSWLKDKIKKGCNKKVLLKRVPILAWLPSYSVEYAIADLLAGLTVGLTVIPQAIAYANVAGLPPQVGLYSSFMSCFVYTIFGSTKDAAVGPTAIEGLLTRENNHGFGEDGSTILCFLSGIIVFLMGVFQLGFLIDFISGPVSVGFTSAAAIIIATTQVKDILGLTYPGSNFLIVWSQIFEHYEETRLYDTILGVTSMIVLFVLRSIKDCKIGPKDEEAQKNFFYVVANRVLWLVCTARNIIVVLVSAALAYYFKLHDSQPFLLLGYVKPGLPPVEPPPFSATVGNSTYSFVDVTTTIGSGFLIVPIFIILENMAIAKAFAQGKTVDATQEMLALGLCNIASSFVKSMPVSGALSRGAVNNASGVKTSFGGIYTGLVVIISLKYFTPYFYYIPKASLAAVIIAAVVFMVEFHVIKPMWRTKKIDLLPAIVTFLSCLFIKLEMGIFIGIAVNVIFLLYQSARPSVHVEKMTTSFGCDYLLITPDRSLSFPSVEYVRTTVSKAGIKQGSSSIPVVIDAKHIQGADFTAAKGIKSLIEDFFRRNQALIFYNLKPSVSSIFQGEIGRAHV